MKRQNPRCKDYPSSGGVGPERCRKAYGQTWTFKPWPTKQCCPPGDMRGREIVEGMHILAIAKRISKVRTNNEKI